VAGGGKVESSENDLPGEIHRVPELGVVEAERSSVAPERGDVCSVRRELLEARAARGAEVRGELVQLRARGKRAFYSCGGETREEGRGKWEERVEERVEAVGVHEGVEEWEGGWRGERQGEDGECDRVRGRRRRGWVRRWEAGEEGAVGGEHEGMHGEEWEGVIRGGGL
jgi:hypothetical protein